MNINWFWASTQNPCSFTGIFIFLFLYLLSHICLLWLPHIFFCNIFTYVINKFWTLVWGHTDIFGGGCYRHRKWDMELRRLFMHYWKEARWGCQQMHRQVSWVWLHMHKAFPPNKGKQVIMTSFNDATVVLLTLRETGYIRKHTQAFEVLWVSFQAIWSFLRVISCLLAAGVYWPPTSLPFEEWEYHRQECVTYLFHQWHTLRVSLSVFS